MNRRYRQIAASFLAAALVITNNPATLYAQEPLLTDESTGTVLSDSFESVGTVLSDSFTGESLLEDEISPAENDLLLHDQEAVFEDGSGDITSPVDNDALIQDQDTLFADESERTVPRREASPSGSDSLSENEVWDGEIPEEYLNYKDIDITIEESEIGYDLPSPGRKGGTLFSNDKLSIPSAYRTDSSLLPEVKEQRPFGTCWAFASMASCEVSLAKKFGITPNVIDLSERAFCYFYYNLRGVDDPLRHTLGDYQTPILNYDHDIYEIGGNVMLASIFLANWGAPITEDKAPYSRLNEIGENGDLTTDTKKGLDALDDSLCYDPDYHVQNVRYISAKDTEGIKKAIMDNGIVARSYYHNAGFYNSDNYSYNSGSTYEGRTNHAITVIGWDDDYLSGNFVKKPKENGAWLIRNSWGTGSDDGGYFWISYEDESLNDVTVINCEEKDNYDRNYFYDGTGCLTEPQGGKGQWKAANVYTASSNEVLKAVAIGMNSADVPYSIQIYKNPTDPLNPESGKPMLETPVTGTTSYPGFYTIPLGKIVPLAKGDTFAVVFTLSEDGREKTSAYIEKTCTLDGSNQWLSVTAQIDPGQSFYGKDGATWYDMAKMDACFRIHAYTEDGAMLTLSKTALDINCANDDKSDTIDIESGYDLEIEGVSVVDADCFDAQFTPNALGRSGTLKITYTGKNISKSFDARLSIKISGLNPIYKQIRINVKNARPSVSTTWLNKVDHLYVPDKGAGELKVKLNNGRIKDVKLVDADKNGKTLGIPNPFSYTAGAPVIDPDGTSAVIKVKDIAGRNPKYNKARLDVYVENCLSPISRNISINNFKSSLKASLTNATLLTDGTHVLAGNTIEIGITNTSFKRAESFASPSVEITDSNGTSLSGRYMAAVSGDSVLITPVTGMELSGSGEKINIKITDSDHAEAYVINNFKVNALNKGKIKLNLGKSTINAQCYESETDINKGLVFSTPLRIKGCTGLDDYIDAGLATIEGANDKSRDALVNGNLKVIYDKTTGLVKVSYPGGNPPAAGSYRYKFTLPSSYTGAAKDTVTYLNVSVKKLDIVKAGSCRVNMKGKFDVLDRNGEVTFKPNFNNLPTYYKVTCIELIGDNADLFTLKGFDDTGLASVILKSDEEYSTKNKYKLGFKYTIAAGDGSLVSVTPLRDISVSQGKFTLKTSGISHFGASGIKQDEELKVKAYNGNGAELEIKDIVLLNPNADFRLIKQAGGLYMIRYIPNEAVERGSSYTLKLQVILKDKAVNLTPVTCNYKVTVAK